MATAINLLLTPAHPPTRRRRLTSIMNEGNVMSCRQGEKRSLLLLNAKLILISAYNVSYSPLLLPLDTMTQNTAIAIPPNPYLPTCQRTSSPHSELQPPIYHHNIHLPAFIKDNVTVDCLLRRYLGRRRLLLLAKADSIDNFNICQEPFIDNH